jgi:uncharacterized repeat protein (TIGR01451 family)
VVRYRPAGSTDPFTELQVSGPDTLTAQVPGLTNGTRYETEVSAVRTTEGRGPWSNLVTATPYGPIEPPVVTAERSNGDIDLFWTEPPSGGHPGPLYYTVVYRPVGAPDWLAGPGFLSARTTSIPGLPTNTAYEFGVYAVAFDNVAGPLGTTTIDAVPEADLAVSPVAATIDGVPGASAAPSFLVRNLGPSDAPDTPLRFSFPAGYAFVSASGATCAPGAAATEVLCSGGPLAAGADETVTLTLDVPADATGTAQVDAEALEAIPPAAPILTDPVPGNNDATVTISLQPATDLSVAGSGPATLTPGGNADWQATVTNGGPSVSAASQLTITLPVDLGFVAAAGCSESSGVVTCPVGPLAPGGSATFDLATSVASAATGKESVRLEVTTAAFDPDPTNDLANLVAKDVPLVDLEVSGTVSPDPVDAGGQTTWTFTVANAGPSDATGVVLDLTLPAGLAPVSVTGATCSGTAPVGCDIGGLAAGSSADVVVVTDVDLLANGLLAVQAAATSVETEATPGDNSAAVEVSVTPAALCDGLAVTLFAPPGGAPFDGTPGDDVIQGTDGADRISGRGGNDTICGLGGDDVLLGGPGDDVLLGGDGNDKLRGAAGDDDLRGGDGKDRLLPEMGTDLVDGGPGWDILDYRAADGPVSVDLGAGSAVYTPVGGSPQSASVSAVENVDGSAFADILVGDAKRNVLRGKQGDDTIDGGGGGDKVDGGIGADLVRGGDGDDVVRGRGGDDTLSGESGADLIVGGSGNDVLDGGAGDDDLRGGLIRHEGVYANTLDGGPDTDVCRWSFDAPVSCETTY